LKKLQFAREFGGLAKKADPVFEIASHVAKLQEKRQIGD